MSLPDLTALFSAAWWSQPRLASVALVLGWLLLMRALRASPLWLALVSLGATLLHEACHLLLGLLLLARPVGITLWPRRQGARWVLGAVSFRRLHLLNAGWVALAPLALYPLAWWLAQHWLLPAFQQAQYGLWLVSAYLVACCLYGGMPSVVDLRVGAGSVLLYAFLGVALWQLARYYG